MTQELKKTGVGIESDPIDRGPAQEVLSNRTLFLLPAEEGSPLRSFEALALPEVVASRMPQLRVELPCDQGLSLASPDEEPSRVEVAMNYGRERPSLIEEDFGEEGLMYKTERADAPEGMDEIERRPLLASRIQQAAADALLKKIRALQRTGREQELLDPERRKTLARALRERIAAFEAMEEAYGHPTEPTPQTS